MCEPSDGGARRALSLGERSGRLSLQRMCTGSRSAGIGISTGVGATLNNIDMSSVGSIGTVGSISNNGSSNINSNNSNITNITSTSSCVASQQNPAKCIPVPDKYLSS